MNSTQLSVPILDRKNYNQWCVQMRVLSDYHELWEVVESRVTALAANAIEAQRVAHRDQKKDNKALYLIHQGMNDETFEHIEGATLLVRLGQFCQPIIKVMIRSRGCVFKP